MWTFLYFPPSYKPPYFYKVIFDLLLARVQDSTYIGTVREVVVNNLLEWLQKIPGEKRWCQNDSILVLSVTQQQVREMVTIGNPNWDQDDLSGDQHTLIL